MFVKYTANFKVIVVHAALEGRTLADINTANASNVSSASLRRWVQLYEATRSVVNNPDTYSSRGRQLSLSEDERLFLLEMVTNRPTIYLAEIQQNLLEHCNLHISLQTISNKLHKRFNLSQKKMRKVNPNQDINQRTAYITMMAHIDPECLFFTGESFFF